MSINPDFDEWTTNQLLFRKRLDSYQRFIKNFVMQGYGLVAGAGLNVVAGDVSGNYAYINGYEVVIGGPSTVLLVPSTTNYIFLGFTKTPDPIFGTSGITPAVIAQISPTPGPNMMKLGEVDTNGLVITAIRVQNNGYHLEDAQFDTDIESNQKQIKNLVTHKGTAFPTSPAPAVGQRFFRTDLGREFFWFGGIWNIVGNQATFTIDGFTPTPAQTIFALSQTPVPGGLILVSVNGAIYEQGVSFTVAGTVLTWLNAPFALGVTDRLVARYQTA